MRKDEIYSKLKTTKGYKQALDYKVWCFNHSLNANAVSSLNAYFNSEVNAWTKNCWLKTWKKSKNCKTKIKNSNKLLTTCNKNKSIFQKEQYVQVG